jgi:L-lysine 2,3-aminomutase
MTMVSSPPKSRPKRAKLKVEVEVPKSNLKYIAPMRGRFDHHRVSKMMLAVYGEEKFQAMKEAGVDKRMMFGINPHYQALAMGEELRTLDGEVLVPKMPASLPIAALIMPRLEETADMAGAKDPSNQMKYTASDDEFYGKLLHKYDEIVLGYASPTCSAHCRYCYRLDLFNKDTGKTGIRPEELRDYILGYNQKLEQNGGKDEHGHKRWPVREVLLSGGDPLVLPNFALYRYMEAAGQAKIDILRIGSKELAFRPERIDDAFIETLKLVHERYPHMHVNIVTHYTHPDEFLLRDENNNYIKNENGPGYKWMSPSYKAVKSLLDLDFLSLENQTPMISHVNDTVEAIHILHHELRRMGVKPKYIFQGRDIEGHKAFSVPVETGWRIHTNAMKGLSDTSRSRFAMSTEWGKMEIMGVIEGFKFPAHLASTVPAAAREAIEAILGEGIVVFRAHRAPHEADTQFGLVIARRNPEALWISGYEDRVLYDFRREADQRYSGLVEMLVKTALGSEDEDENVIQLARSAAA